MQLLLLHNFIPTAGAGMYPCCGQRVQRSSLQQQQGCCHQQHEPLLDDSPVASARVSATLASEQQRVATLARRVQQHRHLLGLVKAPVLRQHSQTVSEQDEGFIAQQTSGTVDDQPRRASGSARGRSTVLQAGNVRPGPMRVRQPVYLQTLQTVKLMQQPVCLRLASAPPP